jgi:hypothetical protein
MKNNIENKNKNAERHTPAMAEKKQAEMHAPFPSPGRSLL